MGDYVFWAYIRAGSAAIIIIFETMRFIALAAATAALRLHKSTKDVKTLLAEKVKANQSSDEVWDWLMENVDKDGNGELSWKEVSGLVDWVCKEHDVPAQQCKEGKKEVKKAFDMADTSGNGEISEAEFEAAWAAAHGAKKVQVKNLVANKMKLSQTKDEVWGFLMEHVDEDGDKEISWKEMVELVKWVCKEHGVSKEECKAAMPEVKEVFDAVDTDNSGSINETEFSAAWDAHHAKDFVMAEMKGKQSSDEVWAWMVENLDKDQSGTISWGEVKAFAYAVCEEHDVSKKECDGWLKEAKPYFDEADADNSGEVDKTEFEAAWEAAH